LKNSRAYACVCFGWGLTNVIMCAQNKLGIAYDASTVADSRSAVRVHTSAVATVSGTRHSKRRPRHPTESESGRHTSSTEVLTLLPVVPTRVPTLTLQEPPRVLHSESCTGVVPLLARPRAGVGAAAVPAEVPAAPNRQTSRQRNGASMSSTVHAMRVHQKPLLHAIPPIEPGKSLWIRLAIEGRHTQLRRGGVLRFVYGVVGDTQFLAGGSAVPGATSRSAPPVVLSASTAHAPNAGHAREAQSGNSFWYTSGRDGMLLRTSSDPSRHQGQTGGSDASTHLPLAAVPPSEHADSSASHGLPEHAQLATPSGRHRTSQAAPLADTFAGDQTPPLAEHTAFEDVPHKRLPSGGAPSVQFSTDVILRTQFVRPVRVEPLHLDFGNVPLQSGGDGRSAGDADVRQRRPVRQMSQLEDSGVGSEVGDVASMSTATLEGAGVMSEQVITVRTSASAVFCMGV